jgi:hypothetical protein
MPNTHNTYVITVYHDGDNGEAFIEMEVRATSYEAAIEIVRLVIPDSDRFGIY